MLPWRDAVLAMSASDVFALMDVVVADADGGPDLKNRLDAIIEWDVDSETHVVSAGSTDSPGRLRVTVSLSTLRELLLGDGKTGLTPQQAFMQRKLKIKGPMALALKLQHLLDAVRQRIETPRPVHSRL